MPRRKVIQEHHICYEPEIKQPMHKGEHYVMTLLNRRKNISLGFIISLKVWIALNEHNAKEVKPK